MGVAGGADRRVRRLQRHRQQLSEHVECFRDHSAECRDRPACVGAHADHHYRRHRPFGGLDDGTGGGRDGWSVALLVGLLGGALNAVMITRLKFPPLIVTLGTFSLFRGVAEGLTRGIENYSDFPASFLFWGQGYIGGVIPAQLPILL